MRFERPHIFWELPSDFSQVDYLQGQLRWKVKPHSLQIRNINPSV